MNVDPSDSKRLSASQVTSKYFISKGGMDESLTEFQEKKNFTAPKKSEKVPKPSTSKLKIRKNPKRIKGQKDIRSVLKSKKNDLVAYSNDFDKICKQSGIDVDSEQLQLAIALSKSLQEPNSKEEESSSSGSLTSHERTGKIRTTLQEYGFVVPEVKISRSKKLKKYRKNCKLLLATEAEKQQVISDRYSQVLFHNLDNSKETNKAENTNHFSAHLYNLVTNISYEEIKNNDLFYVADLLDKLPSFAGCLLKDWSEIPGRPVSPIREPISIQFRSIDCSQDELDTVLSGPLKLAQEIVKNKYNLLPPEKTEGNISSEQFVQKDKEEKLKMDFNVEIVECNTEETSKSIEVIDVEAPNSLTVTQNIRSCSPDLFDDEVSSILDNSNQKYDTQSEQQTSKNNTQVCSVVMDLTGCLKIDQNSQTTANDPCSQLSQGTNLTKIKSNDLMDLTECVVGSSQPIRENIVEEKIDLTQNSIEEGNMTVTCKKSSKADMPDVDLTQTTDSEDELPVVQIGGKDSMDDTIIVNEETYTGLNVDNNKIEPNKALPNTTYSDDEVLLKSLLNSSDNSAHESPSIIIDPEDKDQKIPHERTHFSPEKGPMNHEWYVHKGSEEKSISPVYDVSHNHDLDLRKIDLPALEDDCATAKNCKNTIALTGKTHKTLRLLEKNNSVSKSESFFEEFVCQHSGSSKENTGEIVCVDEDYNDSNSDTNDVLKTSDIDLTQTTDSSDGTVNAADKINTPKISIDPSNLGKIDNVSIDYDEIFDDMVKSHTSSSSLSKSMSTKSYKAEISGENVEKQSIINDLPCNSSQSSVFEISDKELDYSLHKSRLDIEVPKENFDFGGVSVMDNLPDLPSFRSSTNNIENNDSHLPMVNIDENKSQTSSSSTPFRDSRKCVLAKTPNNREYIIKIDEVTPIVDYERMTTPERNAELDRYGLKPFKRKRAIQLLTHLYNQTHPVVESLETLPSPAKRFKQSINPDTSPVKRKSPKKLSESCNSQNKTFNLNENNCSEEIGEVGAVHKDSGLYEETTNIPDIRDLGFCEDDLIFQKREKTKVYSCRVPLHIAFHNYVSARRRLRESILRYEPVNIDIIHKGLVTNGFRYDPKDLLKFMDRKCITVKTADNNRNKKY